MSDLSSSVESLWSQEESPHTSDEEFIDDSDCSWSSGDEEWLPHTSDEEETMTNNDEGELDVS